MEQWAQEHNLHFMKDGARYLREARFKKSPNKKYFESRSVKYEHDTVPYIDGKIEGRNFLLFSLVGRAPANSYLRTVHSPYHVIGNVKKTEGGVLGDFHGWCMELETHRLPVALAVYRTFVGNKDTVNTESRQFEKMYHVEARAGHGTLQLLDPVLIELITQSGIAAFEFSDSSVVLYYTMPTLKKDILDTMLDAGLKIAEQVDRNFPLGKYEKE